MHNYIGILNKSTAVNKSLTCSFLNSFPQLNMIIAKSNVLEFYNITKEGLESFLFSKIYGNVLILEKITYFNPNNSADDLFIMTNDFDYSIVSFDKQKNDLDCKAFGHIREDIGKKQDIKYCMDYDYKYIIVSGFKNIFKVIYLQNMDKNTDITIRCDYDELLLLFPIYTEGGFMDDRERLKNLALCKKNRNNSNVPDSNNNPNNFFTNGNIFKTGENPKQNIFANLKTVIADPTTSQKQLLLETFTIDFPSRHLVKNSNILLDLTNNPVVSLMFSPKIGGLCIFFSNCLKYYEIGARIIERDTKNFSDRKFISYTEIDKSRYLLGDDMGNLFILGFKPKSNNINIYNNPGSSNTNGFEYNLIFQFLGEVSIPSSISFLDNNYIFIGSEQGNSQLIKILSVPKNDKNLPFVEVIEEYDNLAPISDFLVINSNNEESNTEILCICGSGKSCRLKAIRKGTSFSPDVELFFPYIKSFSSFMYRNKKENNNENNLANSSVEENVVFLIR